MYLKLKNLLRTRRRLVSVVTYGLVNALPQFTSGLLAILYTSVFAVPEYGAYGIISATLLVVGILSNLGMPEAILRSFYDRHLDEVAARKYLASLVYGSRLLSFLTLPLIGGALYIVWNAVHTGSTHAGLYIILLVMASFFDRSTELLGAICRLLERPGYFAIGQIVQSIVTVVCAYILVFMLRMGIPGALLAILTGRTTSSIIYHLICRYRLGIRGALFRWHDLKACLMLGLPLVPSRLAIWVRGSGPRPILAYVLPLATLGIFSLGNTIATMPNLVVTAFDMAISPLYFRQKASGSREFIDKIRDFGVVLSASVLPIWACGILFSHEFFSLFAHKYSGAAPIAAVLLCATFLRTQHSYLLRQIQFLRRNQVLPMIMVPAALLTAALMLSLSPIFGVIAAAWSMVLVEALVLISLAVVVQWHERLDFRLDAAFIFSMVLLLLSLWVSFGTPHPPQWSVLATKEVLIAVLVLGCFWICIWPKREFIRALVRS